MIIYHPAFDACHGALRAFAICNAVGKTLEVEKLQIVDFYLVFPEHLASFRLPRKFVKWKGFSKNLNGEYKNRQYQKTLFASYVKTSGISLEMLLSKGLIDASAFRDGRVELLGLDGCEELVSLSDEFDNRTNDYFKFISQLADEVPLYGKNGMKDRSGLLEYRNDVL